jgi:PAS domain S-box-containing protein
MIAEDLFAGDSEMARLMRSSVAGVETAASGLSMLGPSGTWSSSLKNACSVLFNSCCPMFVVWDCDPAQSSATTRLLLYNDAYLSILNQSHQRVPFGQPISTCWSDEWRDVRADVEQVFATGQPVQRSNQPVPIHQDNQARVHCYTWSYSAIWNEAGQISGVFATGCQVATSSHSPATEIELQRWQEADLEASDARFRNIANYAPMMIWISATDGSGIWFNRQWCQFTGQTLEEALGDGWLAALHPEDAQSIAETCWQAHQNHASVQLEYRLRRHDGDYRWVFDSAVPWFDESGTYLGYIGSIIDITDRKRGEDERKHAEAALRQSEDHFRTLADNIAQLAWMADENGWLFWYNRRWLEYTGTTLTEMEGWGWQKVHHPDHVERVVERFRHCIETGTPWEDTFPLRSNAGDYRWFLSRAIPIRNDQGKILRWFGTNTDITDRKLAEEALRQSEEQLRLAQRAAGAGLWDWDITANRVTWSDEYYQLYGLDASITPSYDNWLASILEADRERVDQTAHDTLTHQTNLNVEFRIHHPTRGIRWLAAIGRTFSNANGIPQRMTGIALDITDRKQAEAALHQSEERYRYLAESIPQLVWTADADGMLLDVNQRWLVFTGLTLAQVQTEGWESVIHPDDVPVLSQQWAAAQHNGTYYQAEGRMRQVDGGYRWHLHQAVPLKNEQGQVIKWFGTATDIEDQKQLERQRNRLLEGERSAREAAETANRIKDEFLAVLSHELRSSLNPILGWAKLLQTRQFDQAATKRALETIERNAKLQTQLIDDLLDVSRILRGKMVLDVCPVDLVTVIDAALETVRLSAEVKGIEIHKAIASDIGPIAGDAGRLQQIVWNLLSNAVKFTPQGGQIDIRLEQVGTEAQIQVRDTGKGITPEFLPHVFEYFQQEDGTTTRKFGGLGLGLAIVRYLTEQHGGTVQVESPGEGLGATFTVLLPLLPREDDQRTDAALAASAEEDAFPLEHLQILVVDDEADMRELMVTMLRQTGARITVAASAVEALDALVLFQPDVLISDIGMPNVDGYGLMRQVRSLPPEQGGQIPAIALTAYAGEIDQQQALAAGFQRHIAKPVEPENLIRAIVTLANQRKRSSDVAA